MDEDPRVTGYAYHVDPDEDKIIHVGNVTECTIRGLAPGKRHLIGLHACDAHGNMTHTVWLTNRRIRE